MTELVKPITKAKSVNTYIAVRNAARAIAFYEQAFGAKEDFRLDTPDGKVILSKLQIGNHTLQVSDEFPQHESYVSSPQSLSGTSCIIHLYVDNADVVVGAALKAGAKLKTPLSDVFWGERYGQVEDPFGHIWSVSAITEEIAPEEIKFRARHFFDQQFQTILR